MTCQIEADAITAKFCKPLLRRREVLQVTGLERGRLQGWEQQGLWTWPGESSPEKRLYTVGDTLRFALAAEMELCGIPIRRAWDFIRDTPTMILQSAPPYLLFLEVYRHGAGSQTFWKGGTRAEVRDFVRTAMSALNDGHVRGIRSSVVNIGCIRGATLETIAFLGYKLAALPEGELQANDAEEAES